ncbi:MAG: YitT family protein [Syntrophomonadaceae bacterium]|nr:YitT family protein [Syntrophomonadaceae bacterium]
MKSKTYIEKYSWRDIIGILFGCFILALAIQAVLVPAHLLSGGVTGIAIILNYLTAWDIWIWYAILNIPIFLAGYRFVSRRFVLYSIIGTAVLSFFLALMKPLNFGIDDLFLAAVLGGILAGIGTGIIFRSKGSSGGTDIIAVIVKRYWGYNIGQTVFVSNLLVIALSLISSTIELALYSAIAIFVASQMVDTVESGLQISRTVMIISRNSQDIAAAILHNLNRGCTYLSGIGAYSGEDVRLIMTTIGKTQVPRLKEIVFHVDPDAFIIINEAIEVYGQGFKESQSDF